MSDEIGTALVLFLAILAAYLLMPPVNF
jgi:hypothetical protein